MAELFYYKAALNVKNAKAKPLLYRIGTDSCKEQPEYVDTTLLLPVNSSEKNVRAVIEVSNSQNEIFGFDDEYYGIIVAQLFGVYLDTHYS